ncbi:HAD-IIB family hydrolase [Fulvimarina endophytica]|uniref:sucrose-phosphate synthase n=1 Tax=Fulvimarina endophytica TaxID=2293836 RepID=A0A371X552_9HYPH|nr:HAD-IIB family hydrolase [Fulvimarina endophytica]RFC64352.1 HAD-IIB family hydrolase [Fulvimarina endophytica]
MFVVHVALQGCLKARDVQYGLTPDTGGHIKYLLELVEAQERDPAIDRIVIATRGFQSDLGDVYRAGFERVSSKVSILRLESARPGYLAKEDLHTETASYAEALAAWLELQDARPAYLHAHYADAATVAARVREAMGIPFVFTAHSLGRVKMATLAGSAISEAERASLMGRIAIEDEAFAKADLVIASSRDEAELQYADFASYDPGKIRIVEPGSNLAAYRDAVCEDEVRAELSRFLRDPEKPVVLAIARPVQKKNLPMLVEAFGADPWLRENANLVILAGTREAICDLEGETAGEMRRILEAIDTHDLYGCVAIPKTHRPMDVPSVYAFARERGGLFVNPALNEPFGLTLLEAAASGLPIVATDSGGPNDIVEYCRNGRLVDPRAPEAIAAACRAILADPALHAEYAANGAKAVAAYDWRRHAERCRMLTERLTKQPVGQPVGQASGRAAQRHAGSRAGRRKAEARQLLVCDIDNTLTGCESCIKTFSRWHSQESGLDFSVATGRSFHSALSILEKQHAPYPRLIVSSVGTEIHWLTANGITYERDEDWSRHIEEGWRRAEIAEVLAGVPGIVPQAPLEQRRFKLSFLTGGEPGLVETIRARLQARHLSASVIHSHGRYLDILPVRASKGAAITYLKRVLGLGDDAIFVAGDSGNDIEMLRAVPQSIIVANYSDALAARSDLAHSYVSRESYALGIIEGVRHFRGRAAAGALAQTLR